GRLYSPVGQPTGNIEQYYTWSATEASPGVTIVSTPGGSTRTFYDWNIVLPVGIVNNGNLLVRFDPGGGNASDACDDYAIQEVSLLSCPIVVSGTIYNDGNGMTNSSVDGTGFNPGGNLQVALY